MKPMKTLFLTLAIVSQLSVNMAAAQSRRSDQDEAYRARQQGNVRSLRDIESSIVPDMKRQGADYIGAEFDGQNRYRLKFMRDGSVIWVDIDGRTGAVLGRAGE